MPRNKNKRRCTRDGCRAWALHGGTLCSVHAGRTRVAGGPGAGDAPAAGKARLPSLEAEIMLLIQRRDLVDGYVSGLLGENKCTAAEALRYLSVLSRAGAVVVSMLAHQRATSGEVSEMERFFEEVEGRVRELAAQQKGIEASHLDVEGGR